MSDNLRAALYYRKMGFSVIPVKRNKRPCIEWKVYQTKHPTEQEIESWWKEWPNAQVAIVCGSVSGLTVLDADSQEGYDALNEFVPDSLLIPTVKTAKGFHFYFRYIPGVPNNVHGILRDSDIKNDGGYVLAPPSQNNSGGYEWMEGLRITDIPIPEAPNFLIDTLSHSIDQNGTACPRIDINHYPYVCPVDTPENECQHLSTPSTNVNIDFNEGTRDNSIFHVANCLVKGNMPHANIRKVLEFIATHCNPPFPQAEIEAKIQSALNRSKTQNSNLAQDVRDLILSTSGNISSTFVHTCLQVSTRSEKKNVSMILTRLCDEGIIERTGKRAGEFRILEEKAAPDDWYSADTQSAEIYLPFELTDLAIVAPGDVVLVMGAQNAGKTAVLMNVAKENRDLYKVHYFSSEMRAGKFKRRMGRFNDVTLDQLRSINFYPPERIKGNYVDHIRPGKGNLNIIDYIEMHDKFWEISKTLDDIYRKLDGAICVAAIQKQPGAEYGRGGSFTQEKPALSLSIDHGIATITKCKEWNEGKENPNRKIYNFKIVDGCRLKRAKRDLGWHQKGEYDHGI